MFKDIKKNLSLALNYEQEEMNKLAYTQYLYCTELISKELQSNKNIENDYHEKLITFSIDCLKRAKICKEKIDQKVNSTSFSLKKPVAPLNERFTKEETEMLSKNYSKLTQFKVFESSLYFLGHSTEFNALIYSIFKNTEVDEYQYKMAIILKGDENEQLSMAYKLFDNNQKGYILKKDFIKVFELIYEILTFLSIEPPLTISEIVTFNKEKISKQEFFNFFKNTEILALGLTKRIQPYPTSGIPIPVGHPSFEKVINMMLGIELSLNYFSKNLDYILTIHLPRIPNQTEHKFIDFYPNIFKKIRKIFHVSDQDYLNSFGISQFLGNLLIGKWNTLSEKLTDGKSGNFFFWTHNGLFLCKTITNDEFETLQSILKDYLEYVEKNPKTLLCKYYGLYVIDDTPFVVMGNIFSKEVDEIFDLKGSTHGRTGKGILKDLDFISRNQKILIKNSEQFLSQMTKDAEFLEKHSIIDYSLLVGIKDEKEYFFGIIDILIQYGFKKFAEHHIKSFIHGDETSISVTRPDYYSQRFIKFIKSIIEEY